MDDKEVKFIRFLKQSIPSYINKVKRGQWSAAEASRYFSDQLKKIKDKKKAQELLNTFNTKLKEARQQALGSPGRRSVSPNSTLQPVAIINGPSSIGPNQNITLKGETVDFPGDESYNWEVEGGGDGIFHGLGDQANDGGGKTFIIKTGAECKTGVLYISATGIKSGASGAVTIQVIGVDSQGEDAGDGDPTKPKSEDDQEEEKKKSEDEAEATQDADKEEQKASWLDWLSKEGRKKALDALKKKFSKEAWAAFWKAILPYLPWIILAIIILVAGIAIMAGISNDAGTGKAGSTFNKPADPIADSTAITKTIMASGNKEAKTKINNQTFTDIQKELSALAQTTAPASTLSEENKTKVTDVSTKIDQYLISNDATLGREIIASIEDILKSTDEQAPIIKVQTRLPLDAISNFNWELHYGTPMRKELPSKDGGHGTYMYYGEGKADAVDLYTTPDSLIYPMFSGQVVNVSDDGVGHKKIVIKNGEYELLYAHVDLDKNIGEGTAVSIDKAIGRVAKIEDYTQVHLELSYCGLPIVTTLIDKIDYEQSEGKSWGEYLWNNIKKVLNL